MLSHAEARKYIVAGFKAIFGREPTVPEAQAVQGVGWLETQYASGWRSDTKPNWNWGAIQSGRPPCNPATSFQYTDTHPTASGASIPYTICFAKYATPEAGAAALVREVYQKRPKVLAAATAGDL